MDYSAGLASVCITPEQPIWLHGYAAKDRERPFEGKMQDLHAKALALEDQSGSRVLLVTMDLCVLRKDEASRMASKIAERTGLPPECIIVNLSHTHSGPMIGREDPIRYPVPPEIQERMQVYTDQLIEHVGEVSAAALADLRPARLLWERGRVGFVRNRRQFNEHGQYKRMGPNPDGFTDPRVTVLRVENPDHTPRAFIFSLACHAVTLGPKNIRLSGDYPGFAQEMIEARHPGVQAMFVQGCGADVNSEPRSTPDQEEWVQRHGEELALETERVAQGPMNPIRSPIRAAQSWLDLPLRQFSREELQTLSIGPEHAAHNAKRLLLLLDRHETPARTYRAPLVVWKFNQDLTLVALPGEVVSEYIPLIEKRVGRENLWMAGYCNEVFGYLPTARMISEGGYETRGLIREIGVFAPETEAVVLEGVCRLCGR